MITGLAALNKSNRPNPGDDMRYPDQRKPDQNRGAPVDKIPAFMPGQEAALVQQLNQGFGGGQPQWDNYLDMVYGPLKVKPFTPGLPESGNKDLRPGQPKVRANVDLTNPNVTKVTAQYYPGDYVTGLAALRGRT